jgi:hypothetical protein
LSPLLRCPWEFLLSLPFEAVVGGRYPLERASEALEDVEGLRVTKAIIVP